MRSDEVESFYSGYYESGDKIKPEALTKLGYRFTARFLIIAGKYKLFELLPLKSDQPADACFLTEVVTSRFRGVIVPDPFHEHRAALSVAKEPLLNGAAKQQVKPHQDQG